MKPLTLLKGILNKCNQKEYDIGPILSAIDKEIKPLKNDFRWGYSPEFTISAKYRVHRSYAEFLETNGVSLEDIELLLANIDAKHAEKYNKEYITNLAKERKLL